MTNEIGKVVWRVRARDGATHAGAFDALVLPTDAGEERRWAHPTRLMGVSVPYDAELPDTPMTLVIRAHADAGPLVVEYEAVGPQGARGVYGRSSDPLAVIVRSTSGILITGLPAPAPDHPAS